MPRPVVPMAFAPRACSRALSSATCEGRISGQFGEMRRRSNTGTPWSISVCASLEQRLERQHHAVADEAAHVLVQDAGGDQRQDGLLAADDERMAGVVAALEARHRGGTLGQQVDDLAFALIAPLGADDDDEFAHDDPRACAGAITRWNGVGAATSCGAELFRYLKNSPSGR